jgi:hypothetical protein
MSSRLAGAKSRASYLRASKPGQGYKFAHKWLVYCAHQHLSWKQLDFSTRATTLTVKEIVKNVVQHSRHKIKMGLLPKNYVKHAEIGLYRRGRELPSGQHSTNGYVYIFKAFPRKMLHKLVRVPFAHHMKALQILKNSGESGWEEYYEEHIKRKPTAKQLKNQKAFVKAWAH